MSEGTPRDSSGVVRGAAPHAKQLWLVPQTGESGRALVADVALQSRTWHLVPYAVSADLAERVRPGAAVVAPGSPRGRPTPGICVRVSERAWDQTLRPLLEVMPGPTWLSPPLVELGLWVAQYYVCPPWKSVSAILPACARRRRTRLQVFLQLGDLPPAKPTAAQRRLLDVLSAGPMPRRAALRDARVSGVVLKRLLASGALRSDRRQANPEPAQLNVDAPVVVPTAEDAYDLTDGQRHAVDRLTGAIDAAAFRVFLLFGVPGSGKTEVYVRAIRSALALGRQTILLIPEIALATQIVQRLSGRFPRAAVLHSRLTPRMRADTLDRIASGAVDVVIGTRTAVFAPCPRLGLIVVDEEQEGSLKNLAAPLFHARDVAIKRGQIEGVPVVLGSATPSLETWHNAHTRPTFELLRLPTRVPGARLPEVRHVRVGRHPGQDGVLLAPLLTKLIEKTLADGGQVVLLHNRRGYGLYLRCVACGQPAVCTRCQAPLVFHQPQRELRCHRCGARAPTPERCADETCRGALRAGGAAIQRLEEVLATRFPAARIQRLDSDTMRRREDYAAALERFAGGGADILLGTQMVAKGLDFPNVRLVGVIDADAALALPDFRAGERVFQILVQVVGRAGRKEGASTAVVQTAEEPSPLVRAALRLDYEAMASLELNYRQRLSLPPFVRMARVLFLDERPARARQAAAEAADGLRDMAQRIRADLVVDDAEPCVIPRLRELRRYQVVLRSPSSTALHALLQQAATGRVFRGASRVVVDVDPVDVL